MDIKITFKNPGSGQEINLKLDSGQRIKTTLKVLNENVKGYCPLSEIEEVRLQDNGRRINPDLTYEEAAIYTGSILEVKGMERKQ